MTKTPNRRRYLKSIGLGAAALAGLSSPVAAKKQTTLDDPPGYIAIYLGSGSDTSNDPNEPSDFGFIRTPFFRGIHLGGGSGLAGGNDIRVTPNRKTLHHQLQFFGGYVTEDKPKPYVLVNQGDGQFESRGQTINFTANSLTKIIRAISGLEDAPIYDLADPSPIITLAGKKWRAVATDRMDVEVDADKPYANDAITRVDFYERGRGRPEYVFSLLYVLWIDREILTKLPNLSPEELAQLLANIPTKMPQETEERTTEMITDGRLNLGGQ